MIFDFDNPPFAPDPCCEGCGKPWIKHDGISRVCKDNQNLLLVLKATAIQLECTTRSLLQVIAAQEGSPETPNHPNPNISDLLDGLEP
jgi:hypothetical protein